MSDGEKPKAGEKLIVILSNGCSGGELAGIIDGLKSSSKSIGSHARRELFWKGYSQLASKAGSLEGTAPCVLLYKATGGGDGEVELVELTKRQRGLVSGGIEFLGRKIKPPDDPQSKAWAIAWSEADAPVAWEDLMSAEPCIYLTNDAVYVATRYKRIMCKGLSSAFKTGKDVEAVVSELKPDKPLRSVSFGGNEPPSVNGYNTFLAGSQKVKDMPSSVGHVNATSTNEIYDYFLSRKNMELVNQANKLIAQMLTDVAKGQTPIVSASSKKDAAVAYKNALMKKIYVHESMKKFIDKAREDAQVELNVISGNLSDLGDFGSYGGIVFEMFYRADLGAF